MNGRALCRYGFWLSLLLFFYGTLFPFHFDFAGFSWSQFGLLPFWDAGRGRVHSLPDMLSNVLLTVPAGFFGLLCFGRQKRVVRWFAFAFLAGLLVETIQLAVPSRLSSVTDALNNGIGAWIGAGFAALFGSHILDFLSGSFLDEKQTRCAILAGITAAGMLLPFDFGLDVSHIASTVRRVWANPWELGTPVQDEWVQAAEFAILGALAGLIRRRRILFASLALPFVLEAMQFLVESHAPSGRDLAMNLAAVASGLAVARIRPGLARPSVGFGLMNLAIIAQGLSPYRFGERSHFEWVPLIEYYNQTTGAALYDALSGILIYGLLAALWPRKTTILWAMTLAVGIEWAQTFIPGRSAGVTDVLIAGIGAFLGPQIAQISPEIVGGAENHP